MKKKIIFFVLTVIIWKVSFSQNDCNICEKLENNVVKITTHFSDGSDQNGFGTIIGENGGKLLVLTAKHVIYKLDNTDIQTQQVNIKFNTDRGTDYSGTLLNLSNNRFDITLVEVVKPQNFSWTKDFYSNSTQRGTQVWFIGRAGEWYIPTGNSSGEINLLTVNDEISIDINSVAPGTSGAPLISKDGLVGMIFEDASTGATAYPIDKIKQIMGTWNYKLQMNLNPNISTNAQTTNANISTPPFTIVKQLTEDNFCDVLNNILQDKNRNYDDYKGIHLYTKNAVAYYKTKLSSDVFYSEIVQRSSGTIFRLKHDEPDDKEKLETLFLKYSHQLAICTKIPGRVKYQKSDFGSGNDKTAIFKDDDRDIELYFDSYALYISLEIK